MTTMDDHHGARGQRAAGLAAGRPYTTLDWA